MNSKILIVDDEVELAETFADLFEFEKIPTVVAHDGMAALEIIDRENISVIISDSQMPKLTGPDLAKRLKDRGKKRGFILVTGYSLTSKDQLENLGIDYMLSKPIDTEELINKTKELLTKFLQTK